MKTLIFLIPLSLVSILFTGYYETRWAEDNRIIFFIKSAPTFQICFESLFDSDADDKPLERLSRKEREQVVKYCKYRLGIDTALATQAELNICKGR
jgi:hypothetical protein